MNDLKHKILDTVKDELAEIETSLHENLSPHFDLIAQVTSHIMFSGGKRLRPLLTVLCAKLCGYTGNYDKKFSTIFEYLHAASLLHDDIVDGASLRRGRPVANSIWGSTAAVLVGDFLLARSLSIAAEAHSLKIIRTIAEVTEKMSQGEIHQLIRKGDPNLSEEEYMEIIERKTAVLIQGACRSGALIAEASDQKADALSAYGLNIGIAFQMADDLLDYTSDVTSLGKDVGSDLREGKMTLPLIYALKTADAGQRASMEKIIADQNFSVQDFRALTERIETCGGVSYTKEKAARYVERAKTDLSVFEDSEIKSLLLNIADYALDRKA